MLFNHFRISAASIVFACITKNVAAADGCYIVNSVPQARIYVTKQIGSDTSPTRFFSGSDFLLVDCPTGALSHAAILRDATVPRMYCWADRRPGGDSANNPYEYNVNGYLVTFDVEQCPIDDYVPLALVIMAYVVTSIFRRASPLKTITSIMG